ncbi:MAG: hypothetical protein JEZ05_06135 [Tenericutes bacterium]|nr:hypothetical protein [Mycoplasmatota bacterium]
MKNFKKILAALLLVLAIGGLTACSQMNKVTTYFEDQGYVRYKYNNIGDSLLFSIHDDLVVEEALRLHEDTNNEETTTVVTDADSTVTTTAAASNSDIYYGFISYAFSNDDYAVVIMEFESEDFLAERLADSTVLQTAFEGLDPADYVNGNCLLIVLDEYVDNYDEFVQIFQGLLEPIE